MNRFPLWCLLGALTTGAAFPAAREPSLPSAVAAGRYAYQGVVYDRILGVPARTASGSMRLRAARPPSAALSGTPYAITDLSPYVKKLLYGQKVEHVNDNGYGIPVGVNELGRIAVYVPCECFPSDDEVVGSFSGVFDLAGHIYNVMFPFSSSYTVGEAIVYALSNSAGEAGQWYEHDDGPVSGNIGWTDSGRGYYFDGYHGGDIALAINDSNVAAGRDYAPAGIFAATFSYAHHRIDLASPAGAACPTAAPPMATGINDSGEIVGYACDTATVFSASGPATYLPVAATGVSSAAQAINARGDIVGSAGAQAFLYRNGQTTYLPRPAGETAGNAVAYAINSTGAVVGDIVNGSTTTAFLYVGGRSYDLNSLLPANSGWQIEHAAGINDSGQIVGEGVRTTASGAVSGGYSMQPAAVPATFRSRISLR